ncbi:MAG: permease-like cell division protein FtsX [Bacilli bacterium]|nr:permease-like cell division protein FtsX [Bacilli bacterium]
MRMFRIIGKSIKDAFKSVFRNFSLSMASISCTAVTLILVAIALLITYNVRSITKDIEDVLTIVVFVDTKATSGDVENLKNDINFIANVDAKKTEYNTQDEITSSLKKDESMKEILEILDGAPIQSTFVIRVKDVKKLTETAKEIEKMEFVTRVKYGENLVNKIVSMFDVVKNACIVAVVALILVTAFLISNTIKITIFSRRQEINIMRLVGTSNIVIKMPFLIEGFVLGVIGSLVPVLLTIYGYTFLFDFVGGKLFTDLIVLVKPSEIIYLTSLVIMIVGGIVGMFGSTRAVRRYLKI